MKIGILITARLGSTRLSRKHLLGIMGRPAISYLIGRIATAFATELAAGSVQVIIATSDEPENRDFELLDRGDVAVFYGSNDNIPLRHLQAAKEYGLDGIVAVDGDDVLCSVDGMRRVFESLTGGAEYVKTSGLPFGMNAFGYCRSFLESALGAYADATLETGWGRIFDETGLTEIVLPGFHEQNLLRFTLDYEEDYQFFKTLIESFGEDIFTASDAEVVERVMAGGWFRLNESIAKQYWENFYNNMKKEAV